MTTLLLRAGALAITLSLGSAAMAQDTHDTTYEFDDEGVVGGFTSPDLDGIITCRPGRRASLVRARLHFVPELVKSVEAL